MYTRVCVCVSMLAPMCVSISILRMLMAWALPGDPWYITSKVIGEGLRPDRTREDDWPEMSRKGRSACQGLRLKGESGRREGRRRRLSLSWRDSIEYSHGQSRGDLSHVIEEGCHKVSRTLRGNWWIPHDACRPPGERMIGRERGGSS